VLGDRAYDVNGQEVFDLLFRREAQMRCRLLGAAFGLPESDPMCYPFSEVTGG
jgi:hypothetical protein